MRQTSTPLTPSPSPLRVRRGEGSPFATLINYSVLPTSTSHFPLPTSQLPLPTAHFPLPTATAYCLLPTAYCYCLLPTLLPTYRGSVYCALLFCVARYLFVVEIHAASSSIPSKLSVVASGVCVRRNDCSVYRLGCIVQFVAAASSGCALDTRVGIFGSLSGCHAGCLVLCGRCIDRFVSERSGLSVAAWSNVGRPFGLSVLYNSDRIDR